MKSKKNNAVDLSRKLVSFDGKWIALDEKNEVVVSASTFEKIMEQTANIKNLKIMPASKNYFGFVG